MNDITIFNHLGNNIRVMTDDQGEPLFVLKDVCNALGITNTRNVSARLDEDMKGTRPVSTHGGIQQLTVINEVGLYTAILGSRVEGARKFKRWVISEVLPSIRKH
jgi:anti-repressor protein